MISTCGQEASLQLAKLTKALWSLHSQVFVYVWSKITSAESLVTRTQTNEFTVMSLYCIAITESISFFFWSVALWNV